MSCTVCQHPNRQDIDQALAVGSATLKALGDKYGLSTSALHRHQAHLGVKIRRAWEGLQNSLLQTCYFWLNQALDMAMQTARAAQAEGNGKLVLQALSQGTRIIKIMLKQDLPLDDRLIFEIMSSPGWAEAGNLLPDDPGLLALGRQNLAGIFTSPCPDAEPSGLSSATPEELALMQQVFQTLTSGPTAQPESENRKLKTENQPGKREKGGKKVGKSPHHGCNVEEYQFDELEKIVSQLELAAQNLGPAPTDPNDPFSAILAQLDQSGGLPADRSLSEFIYEQSLKGNTSTKN